MAVELRHMRLNMLLVEGQNPNEQGRQGTLVVDAA